MQAEIDEVNNAIPILRRTLAQQPLPHSFRWLALHNLACALLARFNLIGRLEDVDEAIELHQEALALPPDLHADRSRSLVELGNALDDRFTKKGDKIDLEKAIAAHEEALTLRPKGHPRRYASLNNLAFVLETRYNQSGQPADLEYIIKMRRDVLELIPPDSPEVPIVKNNLALGLSRLFTLTGSVNDLTEAIKLQREALDQGTPLDDVQRSSALSGLAVALNRRFEAMGEMQDIDDAIALNRQALNLLSDRHIKRPIVLNNLAAVLSDRYKRLGKIEDIEAAIETHREALELKPEPNPDRSGSLNNLANVLRHRFKRTGKVKDLHEAIGLLRDALRLRPVPHPERSDALNNLANALHTESRETGRIDLLDEVIKLHRESLELRAVPHPDRSSSLNNLAYTLCHRFIQTHDIRDINEAICKHEEALKLRPAPHPYRSVSLGNLGHAYGNKFYRFGDPSDLQNAVANFCDSLRCTNVAPSSHFDTALRWTYLADPHHDSALEAYSEAIQLLPRLAALDLTLLSRRQALASRTDGLARNAASYAIRSGQPEKAVEFLEEGRTIFWSQATQLRTPLGLLESVKPEGPELAKKLRNISQALEQGSQRLEGLTSDSHEDVMTMEQSEVHYRRLNREWVDTVEEVRKLEGLQNFLRRKPIAELKTFCSNGPIIILNASERDCAALVITSAEVGHIPLAFDPRAAELLVNKLREETGLNDSMSQDQAKSGSHVTYEGRDGGIWSDPEKTLRSILKTLWTDVAVHIIRYLKYEKRESPPRIWWCPTGPFAFLPIHAAGIYEGGNSECVSDYAVSSYTPTISALLDPLPPVAKPFNIVVTIMPTTPQRSPLHHTKEELCMIKQHVPPDCRLVTLGTGQDKASRAAVLCCLPTASIMHFACHAEHDSENALQSAIFLLDGPLTVSNIMEQKEQHVRTASLAFLGACQTATGDIALPDEALSLSSTMLFAGFQGVVATMWSMADNDGPKIADAFYESFFRNPDRDIRHAARALHLAVSSLRAQNRNSSFQRWVPFIHVGL